MPEPLPYWLLVAVLASTRPLEEALAMRLYRSALELETKGRKKARVAGDLASGEVRAQGKVLSLGSISGPAFEADLETPKGRLEVRFLLTRQGLEAAAEAEARSSTVH
jgi:hypothetical protein